MYICLFIYFRACIVFGTREEAKHCLENTKDMTVEDKKVKLSLFGKAYLTGIRISIRSVAQSEWKFGWAPKIIHRVAQMASMIAW